MSKIGVGRQKRKHEHRDAEAIKNVWGRDGITVPSQMDKGVGKPGTKGEQG